MEVFHAEKLNAKEKRPKIKVEEIEHKEEKVSDKARSLRKGLVSRV